MLAITADGKKLPQGITVQVQKRGWITEDLVDWIKSVLLQTLGALLDW
jgi:hypothetical protein